MKPKHKFVMDKMEQGESFVLVLDNGDKFIAYPVNEHNRSMLKNDDLIICVTGFKSYIKIGQIRSFSPHFPSLAIRCFPIQEGTSKPGLLGFNIMVGQIIGKLFPLRKPK